MKHPLIFILLISTMQAIGEEDFKLKLDEEVKPAIPMPLKLALASPAKSEEKPSDLTRSYLGVVSFTSTLEKDLRNLEVTQLTVSDAASLSALRSAAYSAKPVARYLTWLRATAYGAVDQADVKKAIKDAEEALARYEQLREEMVERKK
jgi:hypothetical protein